MSLEGIKFSIPEILKTIGNKDEVLDKDEIKLFTEKCREYERLSNQEKQSIFEIVRNAMNDENKIPSDKTVWDEINGESPTV